MGGAWGSAPPPPLFLDQTEARRAEKKFLGTGWPGPPLSQGLDPALVTSVTGDPDPFHKF